MVTKEVRKIISADNNWWESTVADFKPVADDFKLDESWKCVFESESGSKYWVSSDKKTLLRRSDHWLATTASCSWFLAGEESWEFNFATVEFKNIKCKNHLAELRVKAAELLKIKHHKVCIYCRQNLKVEVSSEVFGSEVVFAGYEKQSKFNNELHTSCYHQAWKCGYCGKRDKKRLAISNSIHFNCLLKRISSKQTELAAQQKKDLAFKKLLSSAYGWMFEKDEDGNAPTTRQIADKLRPNYKWESGRDARNWGYAFRKKVLTKFNCVL